MSFCTSCGKEAPPGTKFCEYCGAPLEQPAAPAAMPAPAPVPPVASMPPPVSAPPPSQGSGTFLLVAGIIVILIVIAGIYFVGLPLVSSSPGKDGAARPVTANPTPLPAAPATPEAMPPAATEPPAASQTYEEKYTETYAQVYATNHAFAGGQREVFTQNLVSPPLYIKYNITPVINSREKVDEYGNMINTSYIEQNSWFKVSVYDASTGQLAEEQGFNKGYSTDTRQEFMVRTPGIYRVEMSGNDVTADVRILTGRS